ADGDYARDYIDRHRQLYGYVREGRPLEIAALRVEVTGKSARPSEPAQELAARKPKASQTTSTWFGGREQATGIFLRDELRPGDEIIGPAILMEGSSTVVVDPGFTAKILARGEILMEAADKGSPLSAALSPAAGARGPEESADPVQLE